MRKILILVLFHLTIFGAYSQESLNVDLKGLITNRINNSNGELSESIIKKFLISDSIKQSVLLEYFNSYIEDSILYLNIDSMREIVSRLYYKSSFKSLRQKATILLLDTYRLSRFSYDLSICWYPFAKQTDFNSESKGKILRILQGVPFDKIELDILLKNELHIQKLSFNGDTLRIRQYKKKSLKNERQLQDSLACNVAINNIKKRNPEKAIDLNISMLASWLDMKEAVPYIEKSMNTWRYENAEIYKLFKLPLARLGNEEYEFELLDEMILTKKIDYHIAGFISTIKTFDVILEGLKLKGKPKQMVSGVDSKGEIISFEAEGYDYSCTYLKELVFKKLIVNFPFKFDVISLSVCDIGEDEISKVIEWIEKNKKRTILNRDYH